jgi:HK97 family phage major capsid protein
VAYNNIIDRQGAVAMMPEEVAYNLIKDLNNESVVLQAFTQIPVTRGQVRMPVLSALPMAYFTGADTGLKQTTQMDWKSKYLNVEEIACFVPISEAVLEDVDVDVWAEVEPKLKNAIARTLDAAVLFGEGAPGTWPTNIAAGIKQAGNAVVRGASGASEGGIANDISKAIGAMEEDGFAHDYVAAAVSIRGKLRNARDTLGQHLPEVNAQEAYGAPISYPARGLWPVGASPGHEEKPEMIFLEKEQFIVGVRSDIDLTIMDQAVLQDAEGNIVYNLAQQDLVALRARFRVGWQVSNQITYDNTNDATRYAGALLVSPA